MCALTFASTCKHTVDVISVTKGLETDIIQCFVDRVATLRLPVLTCPIWV